MEIVQATDDLAAKFVADIPDLIYATGPSSYAYYFPRRAVFDAAVSAGWMAPNTPFSADTTRLAIEGGELLGIHACFRGPELWTRQAGMTPVWEKLFETGDVTKADFQELVERGRYASWMNPVLRSKVFYMHALAVKPEHRGKKVGAKLMLDALQQGRELGLPEFQLDVLSDNPAVQFYESMGLELLVESRVPMLEKHGVPPECRMAMSLRD